MIVRLVRRDILFVMDESKNPVQVITPTKWNELDSCAINK